MNIVFSVVYEQDYFRVSWKMPPIRRKNIGRRTREATDRRVNEADEGEFGKRVEKSQARSIKTVKRRIQPSSTRSVEDDAVNVSVDSVDMDTLWENTLADAVISSTAHQIRSLFVIIITTCFPSSQSYLWDKHKDNMTADVLDQERETEGDPELEFDEYIYAKALAYIEDMCLIISDKELHEFGLSGLENSERDEYGREFDLEQRYDRDALRQSVRTMFPLLNREQKTAYDTLMKAVEDGHGGLFFLDAPSGTGKTFLLSLILASIRAEDQIALAVASSGITASLLEGGRTAHSTFKLSWGLDDDEPCCDFEDDKLAAYLLTNCKIIIWDECTMAHKGALEALDRALENLRDDQNPFRGTMILLAGDFRQTLPVSPGSTADDEIEACLKSSRYWKYVKTLKLTTNMRVALQNDESAKVFSKQMLDIGNGKIPVEASTGLVSFPPNFCQFTTSADELIDKVYPNIGENYKNHAWLSERAILAVKDQDVDDINRNVLSQIPGQLYSFKSIDSTANVNLVCENTLDYLNSLDLPGLPPQNLQLKVGALIIMLRNLNHPKLYNGTRLVVKKLMNNVTEATILVGTSKGEDVLIPRIPLYPTDLSSSLKRIQFPVRLAFAMTIHKSQGQSLEVCGINLESPCVSHGQLYVACSRVAKPSALFVFCPDGKTKNIVNREALR